VLWCLSNLLLELEEVGDQRPGIKGHGGSLFDP
jgi:hypothetical protein